MHFQGNQLEAVDKAGPCLATALELQGDNATAAFGEVFGRKFAIGIAGKGWIFDAFHSRVRCQKFSHKGCILRMFGHAQGQCFKAEIEIEGSLWSLAAAEVAHQLSPGFGNEGRFAKGLCVDKTVIGRVRFAELGKFAGSLPVKVATVDDNASHLYGMAVEVFGC